MIRSRRSNAGNRLQSLLEEQAPLDDVDAEFFAEKEDDEDFDLEAEEARIRSERHRRHAHGSDDESGEESGEDNGNVAHAAATEGDLSDDSGESSGSDSFDDENFSDSDDDELEQDDEPADAGEKELQAEQRVSTKEKRRAERNKMFKIKVRPPAAAASADSDTAAAATAPAAPAAPTTSSRAKAPRLTADQLVERLTQRTKNRHNERQSAMRNKQYLLEQIREAEARRAQYVPPKRKHVKRLTQEERLEEAKKTEIRNLSSLSKFVELEEERKIQQRLAMLSRRPKLSQVVRYISYSVLEHPRVIEVEPRESAAPFAPYGALPPYPMQMQPEAPLAAPSGASLEHTPEPNAEPATEHTPEPTTDTTADTTTEPAAEPKSTTEPTPPAKPTPTPSAEPEAEPTAEPPSSPSCAAEKLSEKPSNASSEPIMSNADDTESGAVVVKKEEAESTAVVENVKPEIKSETKAEPEALLAEGPDLLRAYNRLTFHSFENVQLNKYSTRSIVLGPIAQQHRPVPAKRMCPFSGAVAKYVDPSTGIAYTGLETNKLIKLAKEDRLGWSRELGGVFTSNGGTMRHARGVPEGFR